MYTFLTISPGDVATTVAYTSEMIGDLMPILVVIIGVSIALWIYSAITHRD